MTDKNSKNEPFDPEKHKDIEKGVFKKEHKNQHGIDINDRNERDLSVKIPKNDQDKK